MIATLNVAEIVKTKAKKVTRWSNQLFLALLLIFAAWPLAVFAQPDGGEARSQLRQARSLVEQLDSLGANCLSQPADPQACPAFLQAVGGGLLDDYLTYCAAAKAWRDSFIDARMDTRTVSTTGANSEELLNLLVDVEFLCGENALAKAGENILPAYRLLKSGRSYATLQHRLESQRQIQLISGERRRQQQRISAGQTRQLRQTDRQFQQLELELIRQQNWPLRNR